MASSESTVGLAQEESRIEQQENRAADTSQKQIIKILWIKRDENEIKTTETECGENEVDVVDKISQ